MRKYRFRKMRAAALISWLSMSDQVSSERTLTEFPAIFQSRLSVLVPVEMETSELSEKAWAAAGKSKLEANRAQARYFFIVRRPRTWSL